MDMFQNVLEWFKGLFSDLNVWMASVFKFDETILNLYDRFVAPLPEWIKMLGFIFVTITLVFGAIEIIKKAYKLVLVLVIVFGIIILLTFL